MTIRGSRRATTSFLADFRDFILRGNVIDLAVAVIVGGAFNKIIDSLVSDLITPAILQPALQAAGVEQLSELTAGGIKYGLFLAAVLNFLVIAFVIFLLVRAFERAKKRLSREEQMAASEAPPPPELVATDRLTSAVERLTEVMEQKASGNN
jgi:large conductance mechanosensitive channel